MRRLTFMLVAGAALSGMGTLPAAAQNGFALKGHYIINSTAAEEAQDTRQLPGADAFGLGAEFVLPFGLGLGVSGYTASDDDLDSSEFTILAEANYFISVPVLPISPYVGVHAGLGVLDRDNVSDPQLEIQDKNRSQLGYQLGVRFQVTQMIGLDAQWRHMSTSADEDQDDRLERDQVLLGVTLF